MTSESPHNQALPTLLDRLVNRGADWLLRSRLRDALGASLSRGSVVFLAVAALALIAALCHAWLGTPAPRIGLLVILALLLPLASIALHVSAVLREPPTREEALALYDQRLDLKDRLRTADAFLGRTAPSPFVQAAVADALPAARRAAEKELYWTWGEWPVTRRTGLLLALACLCLLGAFTIPAYQPGDFSGREAGEPGVEVAEPVRAAQAARAKPEATAPREEPSGRQPAAKEVQRPPQGEPPSLSDPNSTEKMAEDDEARETEGMTEGGQHSDAKSSGRSDRSQGAPGNQSPASKPVEQAKAKKKPAKKKAPAEKSAPQLQKKVKDRSGATSGRGSSSGSSRNPASTDWSSKDRVEETEDQELEQEDTVDDEESESEARGGLQPNLRDRRPPVNRDLSIGFGNRSNPDANGRGGPGQRKKSRGVASLVLGVPVPDHVKGQVNPGRVKITQERIQPKAERSEPLPGEYRGERTAPYGSVPQRTVEPRLKRIVRDFFARDLGSS